MVNLLIKILHRLSLSLSLSPVTPSPQSFPLLSLSHSSVSPSPQSLSLSPPLSISAPLSVSICISASLLPLTRSIRLSSPPFPLTLPSLCHLLPLCLHFSLAVSPPMPLSLSLSLPCHFPFLSIPALNNNILS